MEDDGQIIQGEVGGKVVEARPYLRVVIPELDAPYVDPSHDRNKSEHSLIGIRTSGSSCP